MLREWMEFEANLEGGGEGGTGELPQAPEVPAEPAGTPAAEPAAGWTPSREEWEASQQFQAAVLEALSAPPEDPAAGEQALPEFNTREEAAAWFNDVAAQRAEALYAERFGPYMPLLDDMAKERATGLVETKIGEVAKELGRVDEKGNATFDVKRAGVLAQAFFAQGVPADQAIRAAADEAHAWEESVRSRSLAAEREQMQNRLDDGGEPQSQGTGQPGEAPLTGRDKYERLAEDWVRRRQASGSPVG